MPKLTKNSKLAALARLKEAREIVEKLMARNVPPEQIALTVGASVNTVTRWRTGKFAPSSGRLALLRAFASGGGA